MCLNVCVYIHIMYVHSLNVCMLTSTVVTGCTNIGLNDLLPSPSSPLLSLSPSSRLERSFRSCARGRSSCPTRLTLRT